MVSESQLRNEIEWSSYCDFGSLQAHVGLYDDCVFALHVDYQFGSNGHVTAHRQIDSKRNFRFGNKNLRFFKNLFLY